MGTEASSTYRQVARILKEQLDVDESEIKSSSTFIDDLGADSLGLVELVLAFEEAFEVDIPDEDTEKIRTVADVVRYLDGKVRATRASEEQALAKVKALYANPRHWPPALDEAPRPSRVPPGQYRCRISKQYQLRDCKVELDKAGHTTLEFLNGNLLGVRGVLQTSGTAEIFEGVLTDEHPFGCSPCPDSCLARPEACGCVPLPEAAIKECVKQPVRISFSAAGAGRYVGVLEHAIYHSEYAGIGHAPPKVNGYSVRKQRFRVELVPQTQP